MYCSQHTRAGYLCSRKAKVDGLCIQHGGALSPKKLWERYNSVLVPILMKDRTFREDTEDLKALPIDFIPQGNNYKYTEWIVLSYINGGIARYEDIASRVYPALEDYSKLLKAGILSEGEKGKPWTNEKDINNFCGLVGCRKGKNKFIGIEDLLRKGEYTKYLESETAPKENEGFSGVLYNGEDIKIYAPKTTEESCYYGRGTEWCTAATKSENRFLKYYKEDDKIYIIVPKKPSHVGEKYQIQFGTYQFMNEHDKEVPLTVLMTKFPEAHQLLNTNDIIVNKPDIQIYKKEEMYYYIYIPVYGYITLADDRKDRKIEFSDNFTFKIIQDYPDIQKLFHQVKIGDYIINTEKMKLIHVDSLDNKFYGIDNDHNNIIMIYHGELLVFDTDPQMTVVKSLITKGIPEKIIAKEILDTKTLVYPKSTLRIVSLIWAWIIKLGFKPDINIIKKFIYIDNTINNTIVKYMMEEIGIESTLIYLPYIDKNVMQIVQSLKV